MPESPLARPALAPSGPEAALQSGFDLVGDGRRQAGAEVSGQPLQERPPKPDGRRASRDARGVGRQLDRALEVADLVDQPELPVSLVSRSWASDHPQLGKRWSDPALRRLAAAGVLVKRRGQGRANARTWHLIPLDEALRRL